ncbi:MAG: hypothetical protein E6G00_06505 [Actinobacteria bacterium]|nr:MAG: hypothetical protein E6G00_06505 [Actinomycetota bacterium]
MRRLRAAALTAVLALAFGAVTAPASPAAFRYIRSFGSGNGMQSGPGQLNAPRSIGFARSSGDLLVSDNGNNRIQEFRPTGAFRLLFGSAGSGNGKFNGPYGLGVNGAGDIYVADSSNARVQEFGPNRAFIRAFGTFTGTPTDLAVAPGGDVYVADGSFIRHFTANGSPLASFGGPGSGDGQFNSIVTGLGAGPDGHVYAGDYSGARVEEFTGAGVFVRSLANSGQAAVMGPNGIAVSRTGEIFVTDNGHERAIELRPDGSFYAGDYSGARVEEFTGAGVFVRSLANSGQAAVMGPNGIAVSRTGEIFVTDNGHERAIELRPDGSFVRAFGTAEPGKLDNPAELSLDCAGNVYVIDLDVGRVREYGNPKAPLPPCRPDVKGFKISPKKVPAGQKATFQYRLNEDATVRIKIAGVGSLPAQQGHAGANAQSFKKVHGKTLAAGKYRATIVAKANGLKSKKRRLKFRVI